MNVESQRNYDLEAAYQEAEQHFIEANPKSRKSYDAACEVMPGGNTRTVLYYPPYPLTLAKGEGCHLWDVDGHKYTDFVGEMTAGLYGHSDPRIIGAVKAALDNGITLGGQNTIEAKLAAAIVGRWPSVERVRFCNSGTEANLMSINAARAATGREKLMAFEGSYHGGVLYFRKGGSPTNAPYDMVIGKHNDAAGAEKLIAENGPELAAVIVEPMAGGAGCIPAKLEFLQALRRATAEHGVVLIFDEVMTSRLSPGGIQQIHGVLPDLTSFGKYIGGGLTFGAFGGKAEIMDLFDPRRPDVLPHAGTFNQNVLTMSAGLTGLTEIYTPERALAFNARGDQLRTRLQELADKRGLPVRLTGMGSMMTVHFNRNPVETIYDAYDDNGPAKDLFHLDMIRRDHYMSRRGMINLSLPMTEKEFAGLEAAFDAFLAERAPLIGLI
jgi:glutamate-1-semialdehyde 2,1-aminomutase